MNILIIMLFLIFSIGLFVAASIIDKKFAGRPWTPIVRDVIRSIGITGIAVGVVGVLIKTPIERTFMEQMEHRILSNMIASPLISEQVFRFIAHQNFYYADMDVNVELDHDINFANCLTGTVERNYIIKNMSSYDATFQLHPRLSDLDLECETTIDSSILIVDANTKEVLCQLEADSIRKLSTLKGKIRYYQKPIPITLKPGQNVQVKRISRIGLEASSEYVVVTPYPTEKLSLSITLPTGFVVETYFNHPAQDQKNTCHLDTTLLLQGKYKKYKAEIREGCLPYQGVEISWRPLK